MRYACKYSGKYLCPSSQRHHFPKFFFQHVFFFRHSCPRATIFSLERPVWETKDLSCSRLLFPLGENRHSDHLDSETAPLHITGLHIPQESGHAFPPRCSPLLLPLWLFFLFYSVCISAWTRLPISLARVPALSLCLTVVLEHAAGIWWMITCHSLFIIIQTINYTSLMPLVPLEIYMLGTDQCENGISFAKCLSVDTARWLQPGCFNSCVCLTMSSLTACHGSHCCKALFIVLCRLRLSEDKDVVKATGSRQGGSHSRDSPSTQHLPLFHWWESLYPLHFFFFQEWLVLKGWAAPAPSGRVVKGKCCSCS